MSIVNPWRRIVGKLVDAGLDGLRRASKISLRARGKNGRPSNYKYTAHADGVGSFTKKEDTGFDIDLAPKLSGPIGDFLSDLTGDVGIDIDRAGLFEGGFNWSVDVTVNLPEVSDEVVAELVDEDAQE